MGIDIEARRCTDAIRYHFDMQGWAAIGVWAVLFTALVIGASAAATASNMALFGLLLVLSVVSTFVLVWVSWRRGEPPRWQWGGRG